MKTISCLLATVLGLCAGVALADGQSNAPARPLAPVEHLALPAPADAGLTPTNTVAWIDGEAVPYDWFLHEFRSTFFHYGQGPAVRSQVYNSFLDRMVLYANAKHDGLADDPVLKAQIQQRLQQMRAFMEYQLAMTEVSMTIDADLQKQRLGLDQFQVSDAELKAYAEQEAAAKHSAAKFEDAPANVKEQMRKHLQQQKQNEAVQALIHTLRKQFKIETNQPLVDNVPFPAVAGSPGQAGPSAPH